MLQISHSGVSFPGLESWNVTDWDFIISRVAQEFNWYEALAKCCKYRTVVFRFPGLESWNVTDWDFIILRVAPELNSYELRLGQVKFICLLAYIINEQSTAKPFIVYRYGENRRVMSLEFTCSISSGVVIF